MVKRSKRSAQTGASTAATVAKPKPSPNTMTSNVTLPQSPLVGQELLANDKTFTGDSLDDKAGRAAHSGYHGDDSIGEFFRALLTAKMNEMGVSAEVQRKALPEQ